jgi:Zn-dependent M32 family carboxypeptidase
VVPEKPIQEKLTKPTVTRLESTVAGLEKQTAVLTPSSLTQTENTTLVVTVQLEEETDIAEVVEEIPEEEQTEQVEKQSKAGKFFSTLKKIKKGDFNELGIKPEAIVAYVKDKASSNNQPNEK